MMVAPDDIPLLITLGIVSALGFLFAIVGKPLFDLVARISKYNIFISKSQIQLMGSPKFVIVMRIFFFLGSIVLIYGALDIVFGKG